MRRQPRSPVAGLMDRDHVLATLRAHESDLRRAGIVRLSLLGFDETRQISLMDVAGFEIELSGLLGKPVELVEEGTLKPRVRKSAEAEAVRAF